MRKSSFPILALLLCLALLTSVQAATQTEGACSAAATNNTIIVSNSTDKPDAHMVYPTVYKIAGSNYFKLRDLAALLNGSERQFSVDYDAASKAVSITTGIPYVAIGDELAGAAEGDSSAILTNDTICINGSSVGLTVFKINGSNYFKLRDLGEALDFHVDYNDEMKTVFISGASGYQPEP